MRDHIHAPSQFWDSVWLEPVQAEWPNQDLSEGFVFHVVKYVKDSNFSQRTLLTPPNLKDLENLGSSSLPPPEPIHYLLVKTTSWIRCSHRDGQEEHFLPKSLDLCKSWALSANRRDLVAISSAALWVPDIMTWTSGNCLDVKEMGFCTCTQLLFQKHSFSLTRFEMSLIEFIYISDTVQILQQQ